MSCSSQGLAYAFGFILIDLAAKGKKVNVHKKVILVLCNLTTDGIFHSRSVIILYNKKFFFAISIDLIGLNCYYIDVPKR